MLVHGGATVKNTYLAILVLLILAGIFSMNFFPVKEKNSSVLHDQAASFSSLMPVVPCEPATCVPAEPSPPFTQGVPGNIRPVPATTFQVPPQAAPSPGQVQPPSLPASPVPAGTVTPISYIYFFNSMPVRHVPATTVIYAGGSTPTVPASVAPTMPVVQQYAVPVFVPQVVSSRVGAPKLVYSNGVVIKPKVYFPRQPLRNSIRGVIPCPALSG